MTPERTPEGKWVIYSATGQRLERWPVDAREILATTEFSLVPPGGAAVTTDTLEATAPAVPMTPAPPAEHSPGVPLVVTKSTDAAPAQLSPIPTGQTSKGKRAPR
jgi:hypothetical protein